MSNDEYEALIGEGAIIQAANAASGAV